MSAPNDIIKLSGNRTVAISEYGVATGAPVFFFHGWPSSRTMAQLTDAAARELGLRIISPDRPGIRDSTFHPERTLLDWPPLLAELADKLRPAIASRSRDFRRRALRVCGGVGDAGRVARGRGREQRAAPGRPLRPQAVAQALSLAADFYPRHRQLLRLSFHAARPFLSIKLPLRLRPLLLQAAATLRRRR